MNRTSIEWTDFTANPLKFRAADGRVVWACVHASPGCQHCYAETLAKRYGKGGPFNVPTMNHLTPFLDERECRRMREYGPARGARCFVGDMTDMFGEWVSDDLLNRLFSNVLECRTDVTWQILTKRANRMHRYLSWRWGEGRIPSRNIWIGVSCEDQQRADERIPLLLETPAAVRFVSAEPLLGPIDLSGLRDDELGAKWDATTMGLGWVIVGGESGPGARPCSVGWVRSLVQQCAKGNVPCFVKQLGSKPTRPTVYGPLDFSGEQAVHHEPVRLADRKGGDVTEFPADLAVRQFPA